MGRIVSAIPGFYHSGDNDLIRFAEILDADIKGLERQVRGITDLINVDKCPDDKLPYLAALTNCPLIGNDPVLWRRQIKNWPYILKLKGTERSLELVLDSIDAASWNIKTFFRDAGGGYITTKPTGQPFKDSNGLWYNIRTHYFGIEFTLSKNFVEKQDFNWDVDEVKDKLSFWFERGKPYHAELLNMIILPPNFLPDDHICKWDVCSWEHVELKQYNWGLLTVVNPFFEDGALMHSVIERGILTDSDIQFWGVGKWDGMPYRLQQVGRAFETGIFAELEDDIGTWMTPSLWDGFSWDDAHKFYRPVGSMIERGFPVAFNLEDSGVVMGSIPFIGIIYDSRPYWDIHSWDEHYTWMDELEQQPVATGLKRDFPASLSWNGKPPLPSWSPYKTWEGSDTWGNTTEQAGTWEVGTWELQEVV